MLGSLIKRKIDAEKLSNVFVNSLLQIADSGFEDLNEMIKEDPVFIDVPAVNSKHADQFLLILVSGNLKYLSAHLEVDEMNEIKGRIITKFAPIFDVSEQTFEEMISDTNSFISQVNHPSKNMLYGMSKAVFHQFELNKYQDEYFKKMKTPNPLFLKRMDEVMQHFLWDWEQFFKKHKFSIN